MSKTVEMHKEVYKKHNSFFTFKDKNINLSDLILSRILEIKKRKIGLSALSSYHQKILNLVCKLLLKSEEDPQLFRGQRQTHNQIR